MTQSSIPQVLLRIGNRDLATGSGGVHNHINPVSGEVQAQIPLAGAAEVDMAVDAAEKAREGWRTTRPEARREILVKLGKLIEENMQEFARLAALDGGTPLMGGMLGAHLAVEWTKYYAGWADKLEGELLSTFDTRGEFAYTVPEPIGIVGIIITWNGP